MTRPEKAFEFPILAEKSVLISLKTFFFFFFFEITWFGAEKAFEFPILAKKSVSISVKTFFFWRSPGFKLKKRFNFRVFREIPSQFSDKPCDSDSRTIEIQVKVVCSYLTLSKKKPHPFFKSWLRACNMVCVLETTKKVESIISGRLHRGPKRWN